MNFLLPLLSHTNNYNPEDYNIGLIDGLAVALGGYAVVFAGLIALMVVVIIMGKVFSRKKAEKKVEASALSEEEKEFLIKKLRWIEMTPRYMVMMNFDSDKERLPNCPLIEVPTPHGDLVDREKLLAEYDRQHVGPLGGARKIMEQATAVIKAEGIK